MKRWQDRGEVQDSDDEELSLESQSPVRPAKKQKVDDKDRAAERDRSTTVQGSPEGSPESHDESEDEKWLQPKPAVTYGNKARFLKAVEIERPANDPHSHDQSINVDDCSSDVAVQEAAVGLRLSQADHSGDLPNVQGLLTETEGSREARGLELDQLFDTALSSPLTEREVSPSPPPAFTGFHFPTLGLTSEPASTSEPGLRDHDISGDRTLAEELHRSVGGRRSLRARNEKQLHPYMFDKAQYLQQCRQRGMRPVRVMEEHQAAETQEPSMSGDEGSQSSQIVYGKDSSSPPALAQSPDRQSDSENEFPDVGTIMRRSMHDGVQSGLKRRKLTHGSRIFKSNAAAVRPSAELSQSDDFSIPPSPPLSGDRPPDYEPETSLAAFRRPRGLTPLPLPTPQISSDTRNDRRVDESDVSDDAMPFARSRPSTTSRARPQMISISSSSESSDAESEPAPDPQLDERRLHRERKRIKGVLPASWLKIDFRAQQKPKSPSPSWRLGSLSPERRSPQKGIAQKVVSKRHSSPGHADIAYVSDDDQDESDSPNSSQSPPRIWQTQLQLNRDRRPGASHTFVDVDKMEVDWVDPMFAGSSRRSATQPSRKRQPKIADAFRATLTGSKPDFSEERRGLGSIARPLRPRQKLRKTKSPGSTRQRPAAHRLSIIDAPSQDAELSAVVPQFVRLAVRNARKQSDNGRHSPSHKQIRLATREDTEAATAVLRGWREGTIAPDHSRPGPRGDRETAPISAEHRDGPGTSSPHLRVALAEVSSNRQRRLPSPLRKIGKGPEPHRMTAATVRRPRLQQTRLRPQLLRREEPQCTASEDASSKIAQIQRPQPRHIQPPRVQYRGAQLESLEDEFDQINRTTAFKRRVDLLTESVARRTHNTSALDIPLERFLQDYGTSAAPHTSTPARAIAGKQPIQPDQPRNFEVPVPREALPHRLRKRQARRIDAEAREYRQPSEPLPDVIDVGQVHKDAAPQPGVLLQGLGPFGTRYATDFDILPLSVGTYFHESSFIGSGDFAAALNFGNRDLDTPTGRITIHVDGEVLDCGAWTEDVAVGLAHIPVAISSALQTQQTNSQHSGDPETTSLVLSNVDYLLRSLIRYFSRCVAFLDPVDRTSCIERIRSCVEDLLDVVEDYELSGASHFGIIVRCLKYGLVLAYQALNICDHRLVTADITNSCRELVSKAARRLLHKVLPTCLPELRSFYEDNRHASKREAGIRDSNTAISSMVNLQHVLGDAGMQQCLFWKTVYEHLDVNEASITSISQFDKAWYDMFTLLPLLEVDANGIAQVSSRLCGGREDWSLPRNLVERLLDLYTTSSATRGSNINDYVRATLTRCHRLVTWWGWWRCESILGTIFDFFARRGLAQLQREESQGSPRFLEDLAAEPSLEVQNEDRSFHIFLKMLASGLIGMRQYSIYTDKKIGGIAWRFIPNHGRTYPKDAEVRQQDLDSLRNHHDLLCILYYATPSTHRLRVELIQNLVDHAASHREACRLSVRAWANLASFQISTNETDDSLEPFISWYREILTTTIDQYRLARGEVEQDVASGEAQGQLAVTQHVVEDTILRNQRQISATLVDALAALKRALASASDLQKARRLVEGTTFWQVFQLYDPSNRSLKGVFNEALAVVQATLDVQARFTPGPYSQSSDESQDYGDSSALQEFASSDPVSESNPLSITDLLHGPVSRLVSNAFGADAVADDVILMKILDTWIRIAQETIRGGKSSWANYLRDYSSAAWSQLRDTEQRRKFTPYLLAKIVDQYAVDWTEVPMLSWWLDSLVEREAMLKFQHALTSALLNKGTQEPLLKNLPFVRSTGDTFTITLHELRQRRLSLLSTILSNMRDRYEEVMQENPATLPALRREYGDFLKQMMQAMKSRYQQFDSSENGTVADVHAQGAYIEFVHQVVTFMQQYTTDICQIDRFFTDSAAFPLPATDPTYVVGRLRAYVSKLAESRKRKELAVFIKSVSERAAVDCQQEYLVEQLVTAMSGALEQGDPMAPSLRHVLMTAILPPYIEGALASACSSIVAKPMLEIYSRSVQELLYRARFENEQSVSAAMEMLQSLLYANIQALGHLFARPGLISLPHVQATLTAVFHAAKLCLTTVQYLHRIRHSDPTTVELMQRIVRYGSSIEAHLSEPDELRIIDSPPSIPDIQCRWPDTLSFSRKQLQDSFASEWYAEEGRYFVRRGNGSVEVVAIIDEYEERALLLKAVRFFRESHQAILRKQRRGMPWRRDEDRDDLSAVIV